MPGGPPPYASTSSSGRSSSSGVTGMARHSTLDREGQQQRLRGEQEDDERGDKMLVDDGEDGTYVDYDGEDDEDESSDEDVHHDDSSNSSDSEASSPAPSRAQLLHRALTKSVSAALSALNKKLTSLRSEFEKSSQAEAMSARANLIVSNLHQLPPGTRTATVQDWDDDGNDVELSLDVANYNSAREEADALFAKARRMRRGSEVVGGLMEKVEGGITILNEAMGDLEAAASAERGAGEMDEGMVVLVQERLERSASVTGFVVPRLDDGQGEGGDERRGRERKQQQRGRRKGDAAGRRSGRKNEPTYRRFTSPNGLSILVGRNRRDNESICFREARADDVWMHARGSPGAHVLLRGDRGGAPAPEDMQFAANLAAFYSDARTERRAAVTTAEPWHIQKPRGAPPGAVKLRREGPTIVGRPEDVPDELKVAREESGGAWDEMGYRKLGTRAKNKKRSAEVERRNVAERRAEKRSKKNRRKQRGRRQQQQQQVGGGEER